MGEHQKFVEESEEWKACSEDEKEGRKLPAPCRAARNMASSLDKVHAKLSLPTEISENRFVEMATEAAKIFFLPYSSHKYLESKPSESMRDYEIEADVDGRGRYLTVKAKGNGEKIVVRDYPLRWDTKELLPICTKESLGHKVLQKMTRHAAPSTCLVEPREITTFDGKTYRYTVNDCEHIIFAEESLDQEFLYPTRRLQASMLFQWLLMVKSLKLRFPERPDILKDNKLHLRSITRYSKFNSNNNSKEKKLRKLM